MDGLVTIGKALGGAEWVQGPGGNVSVKDGAWLHIKASGTRLRDLGSAGSIATVPLVDAQAALAGDLDADDRTFARTPRPSLETYFHAIGGAVVIHTHAIGAMLLACSTATRPDGLVEVPYERPGRGLALRVRDAIGNATTGAVLLASHGLVVYEATVEAAIRRTREVDGAMRAAFAGAPAFAPQVDAPYETEAHAGVSLCALPARAVDEPTFGRILFPDAAVFSSAMRVASLATPEERAKYASEAIAAFGRPAVLVARDGRRIQIARSAAELGQAREVTLAHDYVEDILRARGDAVYLPDDEAAKIVGLPSEQYRLALTRSLSC